MYLVMDVAVAWQSNRRSSFWFYLEVVQIECKDVLKRTGVCESDVWYWSGVS